jgi:hypothetical protein
LDDHALAADTVRKPAVVVDKDFGHAANVLGGAEDMPPVRTAVVEVDILGEGTRDLVARSRTAAGGVAAEEEDMEAVGRRSLAGLRIH